MKTDVRSECSWYNLFTKKQGRRRVSTRSVWWKKKGEKEVQIWVGSKNACEGEVESAVMAQACRRLDVLPGSWGKQEEGNPHVTAVQWVGMERRCGASVNNSWRGQRLWTDSLDPCVTARRRAACHLLTHPVRSCEQEIPLSYTGVYTVEILSISYSN